jgi:hypothetical protein
MLRESQTLYAGGDSDIALKKKKKRLWTYATIASRYSDVSHTKGKKNKNRFTLALEGTSCTDREHDSHGKIRRRGRTSRPQGFTGDSARASGQRGTQHIVSGQGVGGGGRGSAHREWGTTGDSAHREWGTTGDSAHREWGTTGDSAHCEWGTTGDSAHCEWGTTGDSSYCCEWAQGPSGKVLHITFIVFRIAFESSDDSVYLVYAVYMVCCIAKPAQCILCTPCIWYVAS